MRRDFTLLAETQFPALLANWFAENFGFSKKETDEGILLENIGLKWHWAKGAGMVTVYGLQHVALTSSDIDAALAYCEKRNLVLDTDGGKPYFNPGIWGKGTRYFNIRTPFGFILEICQRMDIQYEKNVPVIGGLEHIGVFASDIEQTEAFYQDMGFRIVYPRVRNEKETVSVLCTMMSDGCLMLEVFSVMGDMNMPPAAYSGISRIRILGDKSGMDCGPDGEIIEMTAM